MESGKVFGAGLDVYEEEPPKSEVYQKLFKMPNVILTPHIGAATVEAQWRVGMDIVDRIVKEVKNF
jgi:D-3-phosphoglycerate dehydrogenase